MVGHVSGIHEKNAGFDGNNTIIECEESCTQNDECDSIIYNNRSRNYYFKKLIYDELEITAEKQDDFLTEHNNGRRGI